MVPRRWFPWLVAVGLIVWLPIAGCVAPTDGQEQTPSGVRSAARDAPASAAAPSPTAPTTTRPTWLGTRILSRRPDGFGEVQPTPLELRNRQLSTIDVLPPPDGDEFVATIQAVPDDVAARATWSPHCPIALEDLRYLTVSFWGFDQRPHTGELLVHASVAQRVSAVFRRLYEVRFPIEEMRVVSSEELQAPPTGDGNNTTAFVCRPTPAGTSWSQHAYGLAIDVNPFHNPYVNDDLVLPELASAYIDRRWQRPGMILPAGEVIEAFAAIGWTWGGTWRTLKDWMHFSRSGR